jgi:hypothetical protein
MLDTPNGDTPGGFPSRDVCEPPAIAVVPDVGGVRDPKERPNVPGTLTG